MAAIGQATKHGVIIKSGEALEKMGKVDTVAFDKTGTLTLGKPEVCQTVSLNPAFSAESILTYAASAETKSEHPLGKAIVSHAKSSGACIMEAHSFKMTVGKGISAEIDGKKIPLQGKYSTTYKKIICGNRIQLEEHSISIDENAENCLDGFYSEGKAAILVAIDGECVGIIAISDLLRPESAKVVSELRELGTDTVLLTGDKRESAEHIANEAGIKNVCAQLLPEGKVYEISSIRNKGKTVCMIGDGINDAPALKSADVGVAMGDIGSDVALEAADIALINNGISKLPYLKRLSKATVSTIRFSIFLSMLINVAAVAMSVLGMLTPTTGALVHNAGSFFVILIAALLYDRRF